MAKSSQKSPLLNLEDLSVTPTEAAHIAWVSKHPEYEERPVDIRSFIDYPQYMNLKTECWDSIKDDLEQLFVGFDDPTMSWKYQEAVFDEGIGAGKSFKSSIIITYMIYRVLILKNPQKFLGLTKGSGIYFINMSINGTQAKKVVFGEISTRIKNAPWFTKRGYVPDPRIGSELRLPKNITVMPGSSKETTPLGYNLLGGVMDEAAYYTETHTHDVAEEMFNALNNRIKNRFGTKGMLVMISSPRYVDDFIEKKMEEAKGNKSIFSRRNTSWDSKPKSKFCGIKFEKEGYQIPIEYQTIAERNWERFKRDYMALPSMSLEPYFKQWDLVEAGVDYDQKDPFTHEGRLSQYFKPIQGASYFVHIDLSLVSDATGIAMCHREGDIIRVDYINRIKADPGKEIDLAGIRHIVEELKGRGFNIQKCTFDQFQSASSIQELRKVGISAERMSCDKDLSPYETLKEMIYSGRCKWYSHPFLMTEFKRLEFVKGKYVDHPSNGSKDVSDAVCGAVYACVLNQNNFMFWIAKGKESLTPEEILKRDSAMKADGLVPYGHRWGNNTNGVRPRL